jgi:hypothetical protein
VWKAADELVSTRRSTVLILHLQLGFTVLGITDSWYFINYFFKVAGDKGISKKNQNNRAHAVTACIGLWCHGARQAVHACISLWGACIILWHHRPMHALTAWDQKFQVCLGYTFTPATLLLFTYLGCLNTLISMVPEPCRVATMRSTQRPLI